MANRLIFTSLISALLFAGIIFNFSDKTKQPKIVWNPEEIETSVFKGGTRTIVINFKSNKNIANASFFITPNIRQFIVFSTTTPFTIVNGSNSLEFSITIPKEIKKKKFDGLIQIRSGDQSIPKPLKIEIGVLETKNLEQKISDLLIQQFGTTTPVLPEGMRFLLSSTTPEIQALLNIGSNLPLVFRLGSVVFDYSVPVDAEIGISIPALLELTKDRGIRTTDINNSLASHLWHRDDLGRPLIPARDFAITFLPGITKYDLDGDGRSDTLFVSLTDTTHIILQPNDANEIIAGRFATSTGITESAATTLHESVHVMDFRTLCGGDLSWFNSQAEEDLVTEQVEPLIKGVFSLGGTIGLNVLVDETLNRFPNTQNCLERLDLTRPSAVTLNTPTNVSTSTVTLSWSQNNDRDFLSYKIFRSTNAGVDTNDTLVATFTNANQISFTDTGLNAGTTFFYKAFVFDKAGLSNGSNERSATTVSVTPCTLSGTLSSNRTITASESPCIVEDGATVPMGVTLSIDPGVILKFRTNTVLQVFGALIANGTLANPIFFTSIKDDVLGGDTNNDGSATTPQPGDWRSLTIAGTGTANLTNTIIRYGGESSAGALLVNGAFSLFRGHLTQNQNANLSILGGSAIINQSELDFAPIGIGISGGMLTIHQSSIHNNSFSGISAGVLVDATNNWWGSASGPFHPTLNPTGTGNSISNNVTFIPFLMSDPVGSLP